MRLIGKVDVALAQRDLDLVGAQLLDIGDRAQEVLRRGLGVAAMQIDRIDDVVGVEGLAGVEGDALADIEDPLFGTGLGLPALEQFPDRVAALIDFDQAVPNLVAIGIGIESAKLRGSRLSDADPPSMPIRNVPPFFGVSAAMAGLAEGPKRPKAQAECRCALDQFATVEDQSGCILSGVLACHLAGLLRDLRERCTHCVLSG